jgi:hypothetical protein
MEAPPPLTDGGSACTSTNPSSILGVTEGVEVEAGAGKEPAGQYEHNLARMAANRARADSPGAPREGPALLGRLVVCGICGHRMQASYETSRQGLTGRYCCQRHHRQVLVEAR